MSLATKLIHLEPVRCLTTESFVLALQRFVGGSGLPTHIYSNNGKYCGSTKGAEWVGNAFNFKFK